jgi:hypothetical protein
MKRFYVLLAVFALVAFMPSGRALADNGDKLAAVPFEFVGTAADCAPSPAGSRIVTSAWLGGMGLPDNGGPNATTPNDPHTGLLLSKNGPTADCSSAGARITGVAGIVTTATSHLGFDYRNGGHCGAGAGRFNVTVKNGSVQTSHFVGGCSNDSTPTPAPQDPAQWTRVRFELSNPAEAFPPIPVGSTIVSISILYDEGTDTMLASDPMGIGLAVIDNIDIDGKTIASGDNNQKQKKDKGDKHGNEDNGNNGNNDDQGGDD